MVSSPQKIRREHERARALAIEEAAAAATTDDVDSDCSSVDDYSSSDGDSPVRRRGRVVRGSGEDTDKENEQGEVAKQLTKNGAAAVMVKQCAAEPLVLINNTFVKFSPLTSAQWEGYNRDDYAPVSPRASKKLLTYKMYKTESKLIRATLECNGFRYRGGKDWTVLWAGGHVKPYLLQSLTEYQKVNHFPRTYEITRKDKLHHNIFRMRHLHGAKHFDFLPRSFVLPQEYDDFYQEFLKDRGASWIVKPTSSSRGRGIYVAQALKHIPGDEACIVSRYVNNPLCIDGFKFDVRLYVAVTSFDPLRIYLFREGLTRFATERYNGDPKYQSNRFMHLTNYSVNKRNSKFESNYDADVDNHGNKWSLSALRRHLAQMGVDVGLLWSQMHDIIIKTFMSIEPYVTSAYRMFVPNRGNCFELFGFDILVDDNLRPWLVEVNLSPSLACDSPLDQKIKASVLSDLFNLAGVRVQAPDIKSKSGRSKADSNSTRQNSQRDALNKAGNGKKKSDGAFGDGFVASGETKRLVKEAVDEYGRRGGFQLIYPAPGFQQYDSFIENPHPCNTLIVERLFNVGGANVNPARFSSNLRHSWGEKDKPGMMGSPTKRHSLASTLHQQLYDPITGEQRANADISNTVLRGTSSAPAESNSSMAARRQKNLPWNGGSYQLSPLEAREALSEYLHRVHQRLVKESDVRRQVAGQDERSARLATLGKKLQEFIALYNKETTRIRQNKSKKGDKANNGLDPEFKSSLRKVSEQELETYLSKYTKITQEIRRAFLGELDGPSEASASSHEEVRLPVLSTPPYTAPPEGHTSNQRMRQDMRTSAIADARAAASEALGSIGSVDGKDGLLSGGRHARTASGIGAKQVGQSFDKASNIYKSSMGRPKEKVKKRLVERFP